MKPSRSVSFLRSSALLASVAVAGFVILDSATARAQDSSAAPSPAQLQYRKAEDAIKAKNWNEARRLLLELWTRSRTYDVAASLGQVEFQLEHHGAAARYMSFALENIPPKEKPEVAARLRAALDEIKKHVGSVRVVVNKPNAEIRVDSQPIGTSPLSSETYVDPGIHSFEARLGDGSPTEAKLEARAGQSYSVELTLGSSQGSSMASASPIMPPPGTPPSAADPSPKREPDPSERTMVPVYLAGGVAVAGVALGVGFTIAASNSGDRVDSLSSTIGNRSCNGASRPPECAELRDALETKDSQRNISYVSFAVAGAALVGGALYLLWPNETPAANVGVSLLPRGGTLVTIRGEL